MTDISDAATCAQAEPRTSRALPRANASKTHLAYWKKRIFKPLYTRDGQKFRSPNFAIEIQHQNKRVRWSLGPATPETAAARARQIYLHLITNGWPSTIARFKPQSVPDPDPSIGAFIEAVRATADLQPKTLRTYINALRKITSDAFGFSAGTAKFGQSRGHREWIEKVHSVRLNELSPEVIQTWKRSFLAKASQDPVSQRSARVSVNSFLRCARSLFSQRIIKHINLELPSPLPFSDCQFEPKGNTKYRSEFSITELIAAARDELAGTDPEAFKIFALATFAGLRRKEIDLLPWSAFRFTDGLLRIEQTIHFSGKSQDSLDDVPLGPEVLELFRGYRAQATGEFVVESPEQPRQVNYNYYRCNQHFSRLTSWLREHGVRAEKPIHVLRKEYGSQLCQAHGIYAASRGLRHSSIAISAAFYTDAKARVTMPLSHLLAPNIVEFKQEVA
jgi:hypothetical protein